MSPPLYRACAIMWYRRLREGRYNRDSTSIRPCYDGSTNSVYFLCSFIGSKFSGGLTFLITVIFMTTTTTILWHVPPRKKVIVRYDGKISRTPLFKTGTHHNIDMFPCNILFVFFYLCQLICMCTTTSSFCHAITVASTFV